LILMGKPTEPIRRIALHVITLYGMVYGVKGKGVERIMICPHLQKDSDDVYYALCNEPHAKDMECNFMGIDEEKECPVYKLSAELKSAKKTLELLDNDELFQHLAQVEKELESVRKEISNDNIIIDDLRQEKEALEKQIAEFKDEYETLENDRDQLGAKYTVAINDKNELKKIIASAKACFIQNGIQPMQKIDLIKVFHILGGI
jgi:archaellum component FlaC